MKIRGDSEGRRRRRPASESLQTMEVQFASRVWGYAPRTFWKCRCAVVQYEQLLDIFSFEILRFWLLEFWDLEFRVSSFEISRFWICIPNFWFKKKDFEFWVFGILRFWNFEFLSFWVLTFLSFWVFSFWDFVLRFRFFRFWVFRFWVLIFWYF